MSDENKEFARRAADTLKKLDAALAELDARLEVDLGGDVLQLEFDDGRTYIINSHSAAKQVWVAADSRAWHLSWEPAREAWIDTREGRELWALLGELVSRKLGRTITLSH